MGCKCSAWQLRPSTEDCSIKGGILGLVNNVLVPHVVQQYEPNGPFYATGFGGRTVAAAAGAEAKV